MFKLCVFAPLISNNINDVSRKLEIKLMRFIHNTSICSIKTKIQINEYLLNRSVAASEILKNLTEDDAKELEKIKIHHNFLLSKGSLVPKSISDKDYLELLCLSFNQKMKYYRFLAKKEFAKENDIVKKSANRAIFESHRAELSITTEAKNQFYPKFVSKTLKDLETNRLFQSITLDAQPVVFDLSYEDDLCRKEVKNLGKQINFCYALNKATAEPFQMVLANLRPESITRADLNEAFLPPDVALEDMPMVVTDRHYIDLYADRRIVYLSPDSTNFFQEGEYDHTAVYVIGGIIDKSEKVPLSLARARREGIEHRSFPIDRYVDWKSGSKSLTLDQTFAVLQRARDTDGDWRSAIVSAIPSRALVDNSVIKYNRGSARFRRR